MATLANRAVGDVLTEFVGPRTGFNYGGSDPAYVDVNIQGTGGVKVQINTTTKWGSNSMDPNPIDVGSIPDPAGWSDVGAEITGLSGVTERAVGTSDNRSWLRIIVSTAGTGKIWYGGRWAKR